MSRAICNRRSPGARTASSWPGAGLKPQSGMSPNPEEAFTLSGHGAAVTEVEWTADGRRILSRSEVFGGLHPSHELKIWDAESRQEVLMIRGPMAGWRVGPGSGHSPRPRNGARMPGTWSSGISPRADDNRPDRHALCLCRQP